MNPWHMEPLLDEMLSDPILHLLRDRDGITDPELRAVIERARQLIRSRAAVLLSPAEGGGPRALA